MGQFLFGIIAGFVVGRYIIPPETTKIEKRLNEFIKMNFPEASELDRKDAVGDIVKK